MLKRPKYAGDPRGHSARVYDDIYDSPAFKSLSPHDVMAYLALLRQLRQWNNGNLSLPLSESKNRGIKHSQTLAQSLRALCAVGLVEISRQGGSRKGGQRLPTLYRVTDRECFDVPKLFLEAKKASNKWRNVTSIEHGHSLIQAAEDAAKAEWKKLKSLDHAVKTTRSPRDPSMAKIRSPRDPLDDVPDHDVIHGENGSKPLSMRVTEGFQHTPEKVSHRSPHVPPLYSLPVHREIDDLQRYGSYQQLTALPVGLEPHVPAKLFAHLIH